MLLSSPAGAAALEATGRGTAGAWAQDFLMPVSTKDESSARNVTAAHQPKGSLGDVVRWGKNGHMLAGV